MRIVVTGASRDLARRVVSRIVRDHRDATVVAVDKAPLPQSQPGVITKQADLAVADLASLFSGADAVVHLASVSAVATADPVSADLESAILQRVLDALGAAGVGHLVMMSSAAVYGARKDNPVPFTEDAEAVPNRDFAWALQRHRLEFLAQHWGQAPGRAVSVLRPAVDVADDRLGELARTLRAARAGVAADGEPPVQYLHADDLAAAVMTALEHRYDGLLNVAPDGWISADTLAQLEGPKPRLRMPSHLVRLISALRWRSGLSSAPPQIVPYTAHPWVVANDRLKALGWRAEHSNEEAWVAAHTPGLLESLPARRRQELLLAVTAVAALAGVGALTWALLRLRSRRRTG